MCGLGDATLDLLTALVEKSLLVAVPGDPTRYRMLETIREYAAQRLDEAGERPTVEAAHAALVVELVETAEPRLRRADQLEWVARLRAEADDVAAVLRRAVAAGDAATAQRLVAGSAWFWFIRGLFSEATDRLTDVGALDGPGTRRRPARCARPTGRWRRPATGTSPRRRPCSATRNGSRRSCRPSGTRFCCSWVPSPRASGDGDPVPLERLAADPHADAVGPGLRAVLAGADRGERGRSRPAAGGHAAAHEMFAALGDRWGLGMTLSSLGDLGERRR